MLTAVTLHRRNRAQKIGADSEKVGAALLTGAVFHLAFTAAAFGALSLWAHACDLHRRREHSAHRAH
jgi:hypothetical protein